MLKPIRKGSLVDNIINSIKTLIEHGDLVPGDKLPGERDLTIMLGVSRTSVREALRAMAVAGITTTFHGDGTYLNSSISSLYNNVFRNCFKLFLKLNDLKQFMETRRILETHLVELAAQRITPPLVDELESYLIQMENNLGNRNILYTLDIKFHMVIYRASDNDILFRFF